MKILLVDVETTGIINPEVCEIAATLYNISENIRECGIISSVSFLLPVTSNDAENINGITSELTSFFENRHGVPMLKAMITESDYLMAFNAEFDAPIVSKLLGVKATWICAMKDVEWGYITGFRGSFKLVELALWLGIGVSTAHRAGDDVRLLAECLNRRKDSLSKLIGDAAVLAESPMIEVQALVSFSNRGLAKKADFEFDFDGRRIWTRKIRKCQLDEFRKNINFRIREL